jgi:RNA polymerase sigma-70 factor (ECF subfamily)
VKFAVKENRDVSEQSKQQSREYEIQMNALNAAISSGGSMLGDNSMWPESPQTVELIAEAKAGDQSAVNLLMDRNSLNQLVRMRLDKNIQNRVGVSDVVQDVLVEANRRLPRYLESPVMPFHLWVRQIARDRIIDAHRRHRVSAKRSVDREQRMSIPRGCGQSSIHLASLLGGADVSPAEAMIQKEVGRKVEDAISMLDERDSEIIVMRHYEYLTNQEISRVLNG